MVKRKSLGKKMLLIVLVEVYKKDRKRNKNNDVVLTHVCIYLIMFLKGIRKFFDLVDSRITIVDNL